MRHLDVVRAQLKRNGVATINGMARFVDANTIEIEGGEGQLQKITADTILIACGLDAAGISADGRGKIAVNEYFQTNVSHIYAAGDVIGFPALAATSMEQGRLAISHSLS